MTNKKTDKKVINVKLDVEYKSKLETLAYLKGLSLQDLSKEIILKEIDANADAIAETEKIRNKYQK